MKFEAPMLVVDDINRSRAFYCDVFGLKVVMDFGENITFDAGFSLQDKALWATFIDAEEKDIVYRGNDMELYFEEEKLDEFMDYLKSFKDIEYLHDIKEYNWGQRVIRFYDPDDHVIEVGESMTVVCRRFISQGMTIEETAQRTMFPVEFVKACL
ncbi:VOC family protein [Acetobacterium sp.]|jgi:catechol 2,3-dioxygenase-like lactoylglutathione lyase family enzyme|uniref:VOC family protein n=1 Tax=Acetobacterium sp. TaxID=1872094 RepID=UPI000CC76AFE|nr:VOC family protein [Acetobacterium sp.]MDO9491818.1 VOC family protein [Acetobacterium sp.]PKM71403.1 MAG: glyoxalase [Firmicutes bacterium HGW-Firmicutes-17]